VSPFEIQSRITGYNLNPHLFDNSQVAEIKEYADIYGIPFNNTREGAEKARKSSGVFSQFTSGFTEGVLGPVAMGGWSEEPESEGQALAHSMGHLLGFALPLAGSVLTLGGSGALRLGLSAGQVASRAGTAGTVGRAFNQGRRAIGYTGEVLSGAGGALRAGSKVSIKGLGQVPLKSVPLLGADALEDWGKKRLAEHGFEVAKHINKATGAGKALDIAFQGAHLGVASTISGLFDGENNEMNNFIFGAVAGGAFGGLGNFVTMGRMIKHPNVKVQGAGMKGLWNYSKEFAKGNKERIASMVGGSAFQGGMATMQGAPTATQIYEYLLGGFFGFQAQGAVSKQANDYFNRWNEKDADGNAKYTHQDVIEMLDKPEFKTLDPEAQSIVKEAHFHHLGEKYDNTLSWAGASLYDAIKSELKVSEQRMAEKKSKKVEDLDKYEKRQAEADAQEKTIPKWQAMEERNRIVNKVYEEILSDKMSSITKKLTEKLTPEEMAEVKSGVVDPLDRVVLDFFENKPFEAVKTTYEYLIKASMALQQGQPELSSVPMLKRFINKLQNALVDLPDLKPNEVFKDAIELFNKDAIKKSTDISKTINTYVDILTKKHKGLIVDNDMKRGLGQLFIRINQEDIRPIISYNSEVNKVTQISHKNILNKILGTRSPKPADEVINMEKGLWSENVKVLEFGELVKSKYGDYYTVSPYGKKFNNQTKQWEFEMAPSDWVSVQKHLWNSKGDLAKRGDFYLKIPAKDYGVERIYRFHRDTPKTKVSQVMGEVAKRTKIKKELLDSYLQFDREVWYKTMGMERNTVNSKDKTFLDRLYADSFKSNYLYEKNYNFKGAVDRVKREALFSAKTFFQANPKDFTKITKGTDEAEIYIIEDGGSRLHESITDKIKSKAHELKRLVRNKKTETFWTVENGEPVERAWESKIDGWIVMHSDMHKQFLKSNHLEDRTSHLKPSVAVEINGELFLIKAGVHPGRKAYDKFLKNPNAMIVVTSSAKHIPKSAKIYNARASLKKGKTIFEAIGNKGPSLRMPIKDFRINFGVYSDSHSTRSTTIKKQMHSFFDKLTMSREGFDNFMDKVLEIPLRGTPENNAYIESLGTDRTILPPKNFDISKLRDKDVVDIVNDPNHPLHKELNLEIFKKIRNMAVEEEMPEMHERLQELKEHVNGFERIYHDTGYNPIAEVLNMNMYQRAVHEYRLKRFTQPEWENSASGWVAGVDPIMEIITGGIKENATYEFWNGSGMTDQKVGHVKLGESHKDMPIQWINGRRETLEKAFEEYQTAIKKKETPEAISRMRQQLLLAVMRVPANAVSGTRALLFDGFVPNDVGLSDFGVYMRGRDHFYIDGADVDGDKVFFYQGLPKEYMRDLVDNDDFLERDFKGKKVLFENKAEKFDKLFGSELSKSKTKFGISEEQYIKNNPLGQWSPGALRNAGQSSFAGKQGMGRVVNTKSFMNTVLSDIITNKNGALDMTIFSKEGKVLGKLTGTTSEDILREPEGYYVVGVEASSRTADSANYYKMADANQMVEILFKSAFKNLKFTPDNPNSPIDGPKFWMLKNSNEYNQIHDLNQKLYGYNHNAMRNYRVHEVQDALRNTVVDDGLMNSVITIAGHMSKNNLNVNPLKAFNFRALDKAIKTISRNVWDNPEAREFAVRKSLLIKPQYWNIDYAKVYEIVNRQAPEYGLKKIGADGKGKKQYSEFIWQGLKKELPKKAQDVFDKIYTNDPIDFNAKLGQRYHHNALIGKHRPEVERDFRLNDTWDIYSVIASLETGKKLKTAMADKGLTTGEGKNVPYKEINNIASKLITGEKLTDSEKFLSNIWKKKIQKAVNDLQGIPEGQMDVFSKYAKEEQQNDWIVFRDYIATSANHIKHLFRKGFRDKDSAVWETQESANKKALQHHEEIRIRAEKYGIDPRIAIDYYNAHILGSISPQTFSKKTRLRNLERIKNEAKTESDKALVQEQIDIIHKNYEHTGIPKFAWELDAISNQFKKEFLDGYAKTFDILNTHDPNNLKTYKAEMFFRSNKEVKETEPRSEPEFIQEKELKIDRLFDVDTPTMKSDKVPNDIKSKVLPSIKRTLKTLPFELTHRVDDLYVMMKSQEGKIGSTSIRNATFTDIRNFDRFLKEYIEQGAVPDSKGNFIFSKFNEMLFPEAVGERMSTHDLGELYSLKVPIKNMDGSAGLATIKVPLSAMSYLQRSSNSIRRFEDAISNQMQENLFKEIGIKQEIEALDNGIQHFQKLLEISVKKMNAKRELNGERFEFYQQELLTSKADIEEYNGRTFRITRNGKTITKSGEELIGELELQLNKFFKEEMYESWIGAGVFNKEGVWEKIDWKRIDNSHEYKDTGLEIHDFIKYDKFGRFDIENFYDKTVKIASEFNPKYGHIIGNRNNPLSVELLNRVQYEIALEEIIQGSKYKRSNAEAQKFRNQYRKTQVEDKTTGEQVRNKTSFTGIGEIKDGYFPQMLHNREKLEPWIAKEQDNLRKQLEDHVINLTMEGKFVGEGKDFKQRYKPSDYDNKLLVKTESGLLTESDTRAGQSLNKKQFVEKYLAIQRADLEGIAGRAIETDNAGHFAMEFVNAKYRESKKEWADEKSFGMRPGSGSGRGEVPMPYFSYQPEVLQKYAEQWVSSFFKNTLSLMGRKTIRNYEQNNPLPEEVSGKWTDEMRGFIQDQMGHSATLPMNRLGLSKYQVKRIQSYINDNKKSKDKQVRQTIINYQLRLRDDAQFKKQKDIKGLRFVMSDQAIIDWLDIKSQGLGRLTGKIKGFGTIKQPKLPIIGKLPHAQKQREKRLHEIVTNIGNFEAKMSLLSLLAHPKTALGNIFGGSQNTITNAGFRNFIKANDTKWLLTHIFKDAKLKDGTRITDKNTIRRWISEVGALESFYVTEASMDKSLSVTRMRPFIKEMSKKLFTKEMTDTKLKEIAKKHRVWDSIVASGGYFMRTSESKLRADAFMAHYLHAREIYRQIIPDLEFNNPYLLRQALKGVEATQFLYHNVNRPSFSRSALGKMMTRFQPFAWNSVKFRRNIYKMAKRYGMTDKQSVDRLKRFVTQDLMVASLANIFVASIFDSTLPPPLSWAQSSADLLFGDPEEREKAFFSSYPHPAMAPLQAVTAPIHRYYLPVITGLINGDWDKYSSYYIHTMYPGGRLARSLYKTMQSPEMFPEFMFGIPVHKLGANMRKRRKENEEE